MFATLDLPQPDVAVDADARRRRAEAELMPLPAVMRTIRVQVVEAALVATRAALAEEQSQCSVTVALPEDIYEVYSSDERRCVLSDALDEARAQLVSTRPWITPSGGDPVEPLGYVVLEGPNLVDGTAKLTLDPRPRDLRFDRHRLKRELLALDVPGLMEPHEAERFLTACWKAGLLQQLPKASGSPLGIRLFEPVFAKNLNWRLEVIGHPDVPASDERGGRVTLQRISTSEWVGLD